MKGRAFPTLREAIHSTATLNGTMKAIASELDWGQSELSMRIALGGDSARPFPADDEHLIKIMLVTGDHSIFFTIAERLGYDVTPKKEQTAAQIASLHRDVQDMARRMSQLVLDLGVGGKGR